MRFADFARILLVAISSTATNSQSWLINEPFKSLPDSGTLTDVRNDNEQMRIFHDLEHGLGIQTGGTDLENRDAVEHFFWGMKGGIVMELGSQDGGSNRDSMSWIFEHRLGWKRILIEGDPTMREPLRTKSPNAFSVSACICPNHTKVHYAVQGMVSGVLESMTIPFLDVFYPTILNTTIPRGNMSSAAWSTPGKHQAVHEISCIPLRAVLARCGASRINFFILDVEGGEFDVLQTVNWKKTKFDVLCIETEEKYRPLGYSELITDYLRVRGYELVAKNIARNSWFKHVNFTASVRPGLNALTCWNGAQMHQGRNVC